jgi:pimeloyl-ACP methyl ester carboxylesterase
MSMGKGKNILTEEKKWKTRDGILITANWVRSRQRPARRLIILAPGFAKYKDAYPMNQMCSDLARWGDVLCVDFRGVGCSGGRYTFGAEEFLDLEPLLRWGRGHYRRNILLGLSLGSYHSLRAAHAWPELVDKILLVSCPSQLEDVLKTLGPLRQILSIAFDWKALKKRLTVQANPFFRWGNPLSPKPKADWLAPGIRIPSAFLVGGKDRLVIKELSRRIFENIPRSTHWTEIPEGNHAEFLYLEHPGKFQKWVKTHLKSVP